MLSSLEVSKKKKPHWAWRSAFCEEFCSMDIKTPEHSFWWRVLWVRDKSSRRMVRPRRVRDTHSNRVVIMMHTAINYWWRLRVLIRSTLQTRSTTSMLLSRPARSLRTAIWNCRFPRNWVCFFTLFLPRTMTTKIERTHNACLFALHGRSC
jgi:hypothetical protein